MNGELDRLRTMRASLEEHMRAQTAILAELVTEARNAKSAMQSIHDRAKAGTLGVEDIHVLHSAATRQDYVEMLLTAWIERIKG